MQYGRIRAFQDLPFNFYVTWARYIVLTLKKKKKTEKVPVSILAGVHKLFVFSSLIFFFIVCQVLPSFFFQRI